MSASLKSLAIWESVSEASTFLYARVNSARQSAPVAVGVDFIKDGSKVALRLLGGHLGTREQLNRISVRELVHG